MVCCRIFGRTLIVSGCATVPAVMVGKEIQEHTNSEFGRFKTSILKKYGCQYNQFARFYYNAYCLIIA